MMPGEAMKLRVNLAGHRQLARQGALGEISRRVLVEKYAPAAVVINRESQILYALGPVGHYLHLPSGQPSHDLLTLTPPDSRARLRAAIHTVFTDNLPISLAGGEILRDGALLPYGIDVLPLPDDMEPLQLVCFVADAAPMRLGAEPATGPDSGLLEKELQTVKAELQGALRDFEIFNGTHRAVNEEALATTGECQATIEALISWKSGLEMVAKETNALNEQLQGALVVRQSNTNILQNILHSIGVAILLLDPELRIKFFTPEIEIFFRLIASDIGRPLGDLNYLAADDLLERDCLDVLRVRQPFGREIEMADGKRFLRQILPYRRDNAEDNDEVGGVILIFSENAGLHRPEQTLVLPPAEQPPNMPGDVEDKLQQVIDQTAGTLAVMLNSLREIKQTDAGSQPNADDPSGKNFEPRDDAARRIVTLTQRERQIMRMVVAGNPSKTIAIELGISQRTVENHRAAIMRKTESKSLPALARLAFASGLSDISEPQSDIYTDNHK